MWPHFYPISSQKLHAKMPSIVNKVYYHIKKLLESPHLRGGGVGVLLGVSNGSVLPSSPKS